MNAAFFNYPVHNFRLYLVAATFVFLMAAANEGACEQALGVPKVYWSIVSDTNIYRANLDGGDRKTVIQSDGGSPEDVAIDAGRKKILWASPEAGGILSANLDGSGRELLVEFGSPPTAPDSVGISPNLVAFDSSHQDLYWSSIGDRDEIWQYSLVTGRSRAVVTDDNTASLIDALEVDSKGDYLYWIDRVPGEVRRTRICDGVTDTILKRNSLSFTLFPTALALDADGTTVYVAHDGGSISAIVKVASNGETPLVVTTAKEVDQPMALSFDPMQGRLYWSNSNRNNRIYSVGVDGEDIRLAFDPQPSVGEYVQHFAIVYQTVPEPASALNCITPCAILVAATREGKSAARHCSPIKCGCVCKTRVALTFGRGWH